MKHLLILLLALTVAIGETSNASIADLLVGRWTTKTLTVYRGERERDTGSFRVRKLGDGTIYMRGGSGTEWWLYADQSLYISLVDEEGDFFGEASGQWTENGARIELEADLSTVVGSGYIVGSYISWNRNKWRAIATIGLRGETIRTSATWKRKKRR